MNLSTYTETCPECGAPARRASIDIGNLQTDERIECSNVLCSEYPFKVSVPTSETTISRTDSTGRLDGATEPLCKTCDTVLKFSVNRKGAREYYCPAYDCPRSHETQRVVPLAS